MLRMEIACVLILMFLAAIHFTAKREKTKIHNIYSAILLVLMVHLTFDGITVITVSKLDTFPRFWNDTFHRVFLSTMLLTIYLYYRYICELIHMEMIGQNTEWNPSKGYHFIRRAYDIYLIVAEILLFVTPVSYTLTDKGNYESGIGATIIYASIGLFLAHMVWNMASHWKIVHPKKRFAILCAFVIEIVVTTLTAIDTSLLLAGMGLTLIAFSFFLVLENPDIELLELAREEKKKADEANASKSAFISVVSHELRTPMNAIVGMTELLMEEPHTETVGNYLQTMKTSGDSLLMIVNDLLDQSKIEAGKMEIIEDVYEVEPLLRDIKAIIKNRIDNRPISVVIQNDEKLPEKMIGDSLRIRQVLINLMNNAVKFTEKGEIRLVIRMQKEDAGGYQIKYSISDTGQGIREEDLQRLFQTFSQVNQKANHKKEGTGLGLSISKEFIQLMGGQLEVESVFGEGSCFFFTIYQKKVKQSAFNTEEQINEENSFFTEKGSHPDTEAVEDMQKVNQADTKAEEQTYRRNPTRKGSSEVTLIDFTAPEAKVLIVDDTAVNIKVETKMLEKYQIQVESASSGENAIKMVQQKEYDLIFMEYMMPYMDGVETTQKIRELGEKYSYLKIVPIVAMTGDTFEDSKKIFESVGMNAYIEKPVVRKKLHKILCDWLPKDKIIR